MFLIISINIQAQSFSSSVIASEGGSVVTGGVQMSWTVGEVITSTITEGSSVLTQGFQQPELQTWTGFVRRFITRGSTVMVPFTASGVTTTENVFTAELSDANGKFTNPVSIGTIKGNVNGSMPVTIPASTATGSNYRIRVRSSIPQFAGFDNGLPIIISSVAISIQVFPNPTVSVFNLKVETGNTKDPLILRVIDEAGRIIEMRNNLVAGQTIQFGAAYLPGNYFLQIIQGKNKEQVKLLKLR